MNQTIIKFEVPGTPEPKRRPRFARRGRAVVTYTTKEDKQHENRIARAYRQAVGNLEPTTGAVVMTVEAVFQYPKSWSRKKRETTLYKTSRPDSDNLGKSALDGLNGIAYLDDSQVVRLDTRKRYGDRNGTFITIERL